ncbi:3'-5' exonuclease [Anaplasmataceae bacterium AB001_6]|nr:3'-5' exonuclease [Anaplasmataceae bacterium AB001_6]
MNFRDVVVFDIETIPDVECCESLTGKQFTSDVEARDFMIQYHHESTGNDFLRQPFHKIVMLSILHAKVSEEGFLSMKKISSIGLDNNTEHDIVKHFFSIFRPGKFLPIIVSFNGKIFDLPVLKYRAMKHFIQLGHFHSAGDKWNSYNQRYTGLDWHCDLLEFLSDYKASAPVKMLEICSLLNIPCKIEGVDGSQVTTLYDKGEWEKLKDYCVSDVMSTYLIYLRTLHSRGSISSEGYNLSIESFMAYLKSNISNVPSYQIYLENWAILCDHTFIIDV